MKTKNILLLILSIVLALSLIMNIVTMTGYDISKITVNDNIVTIEKYDNTYVYEL